MPVGPESDHDHSSDGDHGHSHGPSLATAGAQHRKPLAIVFFLTATFFFVEAAAGLLTNSLALLSDAGHMLTDVIGIGMALAAIQLAIRFDGRDSSVRSNHTFGLYRLEILAAFVNALLLFGVAIWVGITAVQRLFDEPEVLSGQMLVVAVLGLVVNIVAVLLLRGGADESLNVEGAYLEVLADAIGSVGVIIAAVGISVFGWGWLDPAIAVLIGVWILPRTYKLGSEAVRILLQAAPKNLDLDAVAAGLRSIDGVVDVHDLHVWTLTSSMEAASAHLMTAEDADGHAVLDQAQSLMTARFGIDHGTFQVEPESHEGCQDITW